MTDITISLAKETDLSTIRHLAHKIWWPAYEHVIPSGQISLMLAEFYSEEALKNQVANGGHFILARSVTQTVGFAEYRTKEGQSNILRMEKLYVDPDTQGRGVGRQLIGFISVQAREAGRTVLELNVNRKNESAIRFYRHQGFVIVGEMDTPYHAYVLDDYVMQKSV